MGNGNSFFQNLRTNVRGIAKRVWEYLKVAKAEWIVMIALFALDLVTKSIVSHTVDPRYPVVLIPGFLQINYTTNVGAAYGSQFLVDLLTPMGARIFYSVFAVAASVAFVLILIRNKGKNPVFRIGIAMFVAGAMGNCIDRMFFGYVRDFVHFSFQQYIFNIADAELLFGVALIVVYLVFLYHSDDKKKRSRREQSNGTDASTPLEESAKTEGTPPAEEEHAENAPPSPPAEPASVEATVTGETAGESAEESAATLESYDATEDGE